MKKTFKKMKQGTLITEEKFRIRAYIKALIFLLSVAINFAKKIDSPTYPRVKFSIFKDFAFEARNKCFLFISGIHADRTELCIPSARAQVHNNYLQNGRICDSHAGSTFDQLHILPRSPCRRQIQIG